MHLVGLVPDERVALGIHIAHGIDRAFAIRRLGHGRRDAGRVEVEVGTGIEIAGVVLVEEQVASADEGRRPHSLTRVVVVRIRSRA